MIEIHNKYPCRPIETFGQNHIINFTSARELLDQMAAKNFAISHFLKICIEVRLFLKSAAVSFYYFVHTELKARKYAF